MFSTPPRGRRLSLQTPPRSSHSERFLLTEQSQVKVVVRIRPMNSAEESQGYKSMLFPAIVGNGSSDEEEGTTITAAETNSDDDSSSFAKKTIPKSCFVSSIQRSFQFDAVYGPEVTQEEFFDDSVGSSITQNVLEEGFNTTIMAYGVTGSGKTYTMNGVIARAVKDLFAPRSGESTPEIQLSCLEIYKEDLYDLLDGFVSSLPGSHMKLRDHGDRVTVEGLSQVTVRSLEEVQAHIQQANSKRTVASTHLNEHSSRSHAITTLTVSHNNRVSKVTFVDLAGSERLKDTGVQGTAHAKESIHINTDLFVLAKVVHALAAGQKHVPFRDSNLTRYLRESLGGNCRTTLIACVSPAATNDDTTVATLRYAERARSITNRVKANYDFSGSVLTPAQCITLQEENRLLKTRLQTLLSSQNNGVPHSAEVKLKLAQEQARLLREQSAAAAQRTRQWMDYLDEGDGPTRSEDYQKLKQILKDEQCFGRELLHLIGRVDNEDYSDQTEKNRVQYEIKMIAQSLDDNNDQTISILTSYTGERVESKRTMEKEAKCLTLSEDIAFVNGENDILTQQNKKLQDEIKRLKEQLESAQKTTSRPEPATNPGPRRGLGSKAASLLAWAENAIENERNMNDSTSSLSSAGTDMKPFSRRRNQSGEISQSDESVVISNMPTVTHCPCQDSIFTKNPDHVEFYLPNVRVLCSCGKHTDHENNDVSDPCSLDNILRKWQVNFLRSVGIQNATDLVYVATKSTKVLARSMRRWRKENGMLDVKSKSCKVALHIWARTSKTVLKAVNENRGVRPDFLDVSLSGDERTISTIEVSLTESRLQGIEEC